MNGAGLFFLLLLLLVILPGCAWIGYTRWRAHSQGLPPPPLAAYNPFNHAARRGSTTYPVAPRPSNPLTWLQDQVHVLRAKATGGKPGGPRGGGDARGFGRLDAEDGAWDDRVGGHADGPGAEYEEQELGLRPSAYGGAGAAAAEDEWRGRSRSREASYADTRGTRDLDGGYDEDFEEIGGEGERANPFGDGAERSELREASPRPMEEGRAMRKSHFTEAM